MLIYRRLQQLDILKNIQMTSVMFLKPVLEYYEKNVKASDDKSKESVKHMLSVVPKLSELKKGLNHRLPKENMVYKLVLDVLSHHLRINDKQFTKVKTPLCLKYRHTLKS